MYTGLIVVAKTTAYFRREICSGVKRNTGICLTMGTEMTVCLRTVSLSIGLNFLMILVWMFACVLGGVLTSTSALKIYHPMFATATLIIYIVDIY